ncbi:MAG TPA: PAS domain S-box protein [Gemmatimonadaceae bacterium]|nr:PAS domain S-box protein [Gemmatimonadaceae bacterium]
MTSSRSRSQPSTDRTSPPTDVRAVTREGNGPPVGITHETGDLHRLLVESVQDYAIFALDPNGIILSWNAGAERFKGYTADEIIGKHFSIFYPPEKVAERFPQYELDVAEKTGRFEDEGWRVRKDGTRFWANVVLTALRGEDGRLLGYAKVTRDLTVRRAAEEALRQSEERFRLIVQSVRDYAIFMLDTDGRVATWNAGAERFKGYTESEILGKHFSVFYPPEKQQERFPEYELTVAAREGRFEDEGWRVRKDGSRFWANVVITALRDSKGELIGYTKVTRDLTERKRAEEALRESEERFRILVQGVKDYAIFMLDPTGHVATWNAGAERFNSYREDEILGQHFSVFYPAEKVAAGHPEHELEVATREGTYEEEGWRLRKDGTPFWASVLITALHDATGRLVGFGKVTRDLTEQRAATQRGLEDARRVAEAEAANRAKAGFLAAMSHELRTPLNAIGGYADLLASGVRGPVSEPQKLDLERIQRAQKHLLAIISDILNFSRIEAGQLRYDFKPVPLHEVADTVGQLIVPQAEAKGIRLELPRAGNADSPTEAWADRGKVEQIVLNLLSNAIKFTEPQGLVALTFGSDGDHCVLSVRDTGVGIPTDELDSIFEPFVQVGRSLTSPHEGTGLGLAISRDLARAMSGDITVESAPGRGSTFTVTLPCRSAPGVSSASSRRADEQ